jgi:hypothetical protein
MRDLLGKADGKRKHKYTLWDGASEVGRYETVEEVLAHVNRHPKRSYTVYLSQNLAAAPRANEVRLTPTNGSGQ